jgi:vacuolar-type H+-ATPase subunit H
MATGAATALPTDSIEALKRVRATEIEWEEKLAAAKRSAEGTLQRLREESEVAVKAAQAETEAERYQTVQAARAAADLETAQIVAEGEEVARAAARGEGKHPADRKDAVLSAVLAGFDRD